MAADPFDAAFAALATFDWGDDPAPLTELEARVRDAVADHSRAGTLEPRFAGLLASSGSQAAKAFACRQLRLIGTARSVPALAGLLADPDLSHMGRFALERIDGPEAGQALREAVPRVGDKLAIGMISSLANRRDEAAVPLLVSLLAGPEPLAVAAALALGRIGTPAAAQSLLATSAKSAGVADALATARIDSADQLLAAGDRAAATALYKAVAASADSAAASRRSRGLRIAAQTGLLDCLENA